MSQACIVENLKLQRQALTEPSLLPCKKINDMTALQVFEM